MDVWMWSSTSYPVTLLCIVGLFFQRDPADDHEGRIRQEMDSRARSQEVAPDPSKGDQRLRMSNNDVELRGHGAQQPGSQSSSPGSASSASGSSSLKFNQESSIMTLGDHIDAIIIKDYDSSKPHASGGLQSHSDKGPGLISRIQNTSVMSCEYFFFRTSMISLM